LQKKRFKLSPKINKIQLFNNKTPPILLL